jgi:hypothetical protein
MRRKAHRDDFGTVTKTVDQRREVRRRDGAGGCGVRMALM